MDETTQTSTSEAEAQLNQQLLRAVRDNNAKGVQRMLESGADVNSEDEQGTALYQAARLGHIKVVEVMLKFGISGEGFINPNLDIEVKCPKGSPKRWTPLAIAAIEGHTEVVSELIKAGADVNTRRGDNERPLIHLVAAKGHLEILALLIRAGANVDAEFKGHKAFYIHSVYGHSPDIMKLLLEKSCRQNEVELNAALEKVIHRTEANLFSIEIPHCISISVELINAGADMSTILWTTSSGFGDDACILDYTHIKNGIEKKLKEKNSDAVKQSIWQKPEAEKGDTSKHVSRTFFA